MAETYKSGDPMFDALIGSLYGSDAVGEVSCADCGNRVKFTESYITPNRLLGTSIIPARYLCRECASRVAKNGEGERYVNGQLLEPS